MSNPSMKYFVLVFSFFVILGFEAKAQPEHAIYDKVFNKITKHLNEQKNSSFKDIVFDVENAYLGGSLLRVDYEIQLSLISKIVSNYSSILNFNYDLEDRKEILVNAAIFKTITDSIVLNVNQKDTILHLPFLYNFGDLFGEKDWTNMFVTKLLATKEGNCHSLPYLYKILADELGVAAYLALAPNHMYIKQKSIKTGWYNTELTSGTFPIDAWIMASGYVHLDAIRNGVYMKALDEKESIVLCLIDLALGFDRKFPDNDGKFVLKCCGLALTHFPNYISALILKAETQLRVVRIAMQKKGYQDTEKFLNKKTNYKTMWTEIESTFTEIHRLGYRQMPKDMYESWLTSLTGEQDKYFNSQIEK